jgi:hypothetical protein
MPEQCPLRHFILSLLWSRSQRFFREKHMSHKPMVTLAVVVFFGAFFISFHATRARIHSKESTVLSRFGKGPNQVVVVVSRDEIGSADSSNEAGCAVKSERSLVHPHTLEPMVIVLESNPSSISAALRATANYVPPRAPSASTQRQAGTSVHALPLRRVTASVTNLLESCTAFLRKLAA